MNPEPFKIFITGPDTVRILAATDTDLVKFKQRLDIDNIKCTFSQGQFIDTNGQTSTQYVIDATGYWKAIMKALLMVDD